MVRFVSVVLSFFVITCLFVPAWAGEVLPEDFSLCDFSDLGIPSIPCIQTKNSPALDGVITPGEYPSFVIMAPGSGLCLSSDKEMEESGLLQENCIVSDGEYFYVALRITAPSRFSFGYSDKDLGSVYSLSVNLGMTPGEDPAQRCSVLYNKYYFHTDSFDCIGVSGYRVCHTPGGISNFPLQISSINEVHRDNGFLDSQGNKWTAAYYQENAFFTVENREEENIYTAEFRIPVGDVLLSVPTDLKDSVLKMFREKSGVLCGSFSTDLSCVFPSESLICGIFLQNSCTYFSDSRTWQEVLVQKYPNDIIFLDQASVLPLPLYLSGDIPAKGQLSLKESAAGSISGSTPSKDILHEPETSEALPNENSKIPATQKVDPGKSDLSILGSAQSTDTDSEGDESLFSHLPDEEDHIPEDTQILDLSEDDKEEEESGEGENSLLGKILLLITGLLLFASVVIFAVVLGRKERAEKERNEKRENARKNSGKKSQNMKKK